MEKICPVYIVVGPIGTGKSTVLNIVKTMGYYTVDGLPLALVPDLLALPGMLEHSAGIVLGLDAQGNSAEDFHKILVELRAKTIHPFIFYLETNATAHAQRAGFSWTSGQDARSADCLSMIRTIADCILNTDCPERMLRNRLFSFFARPDMFPRIRVTSFGLSYGLPEDVSLLLDLRSLPIDCEVDAQENASGDDRALVDTFFQNKSAKQYLDHILTLCDDLVTRSADPLPEQAEDRGQCHIAFGSATGRSRSVAFALAVAEYYTRRGCDVTVQHRDRDRVHEPNEPDNLDQEGPKEANDQEEVDPSQQSGAQSPEQSGAKTLKQALMQQLDHLGYTDTELLIGHAIIANLNAEGYLPGGVEEIAERTMRPVEEVAAVLARIQLFDPIGSATKDARECLLMQVNDRGYGRDSSLYSFVDEHVEDILRGNYSTLRLAAHEAALDSKGMLNLLAALAPKPCFAFWESVADVSVRSINGRFVVRLRGQGRSIAQDVFPSETEDRTSWLNGLDQRAGTIYLVAESLVRLQSAFFQSGPMHIAPLTLSRIASEIGRDESTISRVTVKYTIATSFGLFPMKVFFASGLETDDGRSVSSVSVQNLLREMIEAEDPAHPLSDDELAAILNERLHTTMARRTVAKYRSLIGIDSSFGRRVR